MGKILLGVLFFGIGAISYFSASNSSTGGTVWVGGMLFGIILIYRGLRDS